MIGASHSDEEVTLMEKKKIVVRRLEKVETSAAAPCAAQAVRLA